MSNDFKKSLNIPKRHELRHYITLVGRLYGEPEESLKEYAEDQVVANEHDLDGALACFKSLIPAQHKKKLEEDEKAKRWSEHRKIEGFEPRRPLRGPHKLTEKA